MADSILDWVEDTRMAHKVVLLLLLAGLVSMIMSQFVVEPQRERARAFQHTLRALDQQLGTMKRDHRVETLKEEIAALTLRLEAQKRVVAAPMDQILTGVLDKARSVDVALTSWESGNPVPLPDMELEQVTLRLHAEGRYHALARFLEALLPTGLTVASLDLRAPERSGESPARPIQASFELTRFQAPAVEQGTGSTS